MHVVNLLQAQAVKNCSFLFRAWQTFFHHIFNYCSTGSHNHLRRKAEVPKPGGDVGLPRPGVVCSQLSVENPTYSSFLGNEFPLGTFVEETVLRLYFSNASAPRASAHDSVYR